MEGERRAGGLAENRVTGKKAGKGMLTHVTRAVACEHPSLVLVLVVAHFFSPLRFILPPAIPLPPPAAYPAMYARPEDKDENDGKREGGRAE